MQRRGGSKRGPKKPAKKVESEDEKGSSEEEEESEDDGEEERGPRGTGRGDPPPGKNSWRKNGNDEDRGEGGLSRPIRTSEIGV